MKQKQEIIQNLIEVGADKTIPQSVVYHLSTSMDERSKILYASRFNAGFAFLVGFLFMISVGRILINFLLKLIGFMYSDEPLIWQYAIKYMFTFAPFFLIPAWFSKCVIITDTSVFVFNTFFYRGYENIQLDKIQKIILKSNNLVIITDNKTFRYSRLFGFSKKDKDRIQNTINLITDKIA